MQILKKGLKKPAFFLALHNKFGYTCLVGC